MTLLGSGPQTRNLLLFFLTLRISVFPSSRSKHIPNAAAPSPHSTPRASLGPLLRESEENGPNSHSPPKVPDRVPRPVTYLQQVQVTESMQEGRPGGARPLMAQGPDEVGDVACGQNECIQLINVGVR